MLDTTVSRFAGNTDLTLERGGKAFSEGLLEGSTSHDTTWQALIEPLRGSQAKPRNPELALLFFKRLVDAASEAAEPILDEVMADPGLGSLLPALQGSAEIDGRALDRLLESVDRRLAPARCYGSVFFNVDPTGEALSRHCEVIRAFAALEGGSHPALRMIANMLRGSRRDESSYNPELRCMARELLLSACFSTSISIRDHALEDVSALAMPGSDEGFGRRFSELLRDAICSRDFRVDDKTHYKLLALALKEHPRAVLDVFFLELPEERRHFRYRIFRGARALREIDTGALRTWLKHDPQHRAELLAQSTVLNLIRIGPEGVPCEFYRTLLDAAPEPSAVFKMLVESLSSAWVLQSWSQKRSEFRHPSFAIESSLHF